MSGYEISLSSGTLLTTVNVKTVDDRVHSSLVLIGQGIPNYGAYVAQDFVWLLENFADNTPPPHPLIGQLWYNTDTGEMNMYAQGGWQSSGMSGMSGMLQPLVVVTPSSGNTVIMDAQTRALLVDTAALANLTIRLPPVVTGGSIVDICFSAPVTNLTIQNAAGAALPNMPSNAYGPGSAIIFRYISDARGWVYWK